MEVGEVLDATVVNMRFVKPLDEQLILSLADSHELLVTVEENVVMGGAGSAVSECLVANDRHGPILQLGVPDRHLDHGTQQEQLSAIGLDVKGIKQQILSKISALEVTENNIQTITAVS